MGDENSVKTAKNRVLLDFDKKERWGKERFLKVADILHLRIRGLKVMESVNGLHISFSLACRELDQISLVCLQALMGSDYKRETLNFMRARNGGAAFDVQWNVLFARKYVRDNENGEFVMTGAELGRREDIEDNLGEALARMEHLWDDDEILMTGAEYRQLAMDRFICSPRK